MQKVLLGLSGGVDSAVAAELLKRNYEVTGLYLSDGRPEGEERARLAAERAGIALAVRDMRRELEKCVCAPFEAAYRRGETPNPCVLCNPEVKLRLLCAEADERGIVYVATGHYARRTAQGLAMGRPSNDQSYMLCRLYPAQAARLLLPLGELEKSAVRALARELGLPSAAAPDSMEICFIPDNDYAAWLRARGEALPGPFIHEGRPVGVHSGIEGFTLGQGSGLGIALGKKVFVTDIDPVTRAVTLGENAALYKTRFFVRDCRWLCPPEGEAFSAGVRVRHTRAAPIPCRVELFANGAAEVLCASPVRAPAPGQAAAFYAGERLLGGGFITRG